MNVVLEWVKSNVYSVVFLAVMIVTPISMWIVSGNMNKGVRQTGQALAGKIQELARLEKTSFSLSNPVLGNEPVSETVVVNRQLLDRYERVVGLIREDAQRIREEALRFNRNDRDVLLPELFPEAAMHQRETLPFEMYRLLRVAYEQLLDDIGADSPPSVEAMREDLEEARARLMTQILLKESRQDLTEEDQTWLTEQLTKTRLSRYAEAARQTRIYAALGDLDVPPESAAPPRAEGEGHVRMFDWQWQLWIKQDILIALYEVNAPYDSVLEAPVKRLVSLRVLGEPAPAVTGGSAQGSGGTGFGATAGGGGTGRRRSRPGSGAGGSRGGGAAPQAVAVDPAQEVPLDFTRSFTGRTSNPLYDVRFVELRIVVDSSRIPDVFDALARQNFITVLDAQLDAVDPFAAVRDGYFYGTTPVSMLTLDLETIWLREWTAQFMPVELKQALRIPIEPQPAG